MPRELPIFLPVSQAYKGLCPQGVYHVAGETDKKTSDENAEIDTTGRRRWVLSTPKCPVKKSRIPRREAKPQDNWPLAWGKIDSVTKPCTVKKVLELELRVVA